MNNTILEDERLKKTLVVIMTIVAVLTLSATSLIAELQNALAANSMMHGSVSYAAHQPTCGFKAFTQEKCVPRI